MNNRVKIISTIGPKSNNQFMIKKLIKAGTSMFRLNGSHANLIWHKRAIDTIRSVSRIVPILFDIPGSKTRLEELKNPIQINKNTKIVLTTDTKDKLGKLFLDNKTIIAKFKKGKIIFFDDGKLSFKVKKVGKKDVEIIAINSGVLKSRKGIHLPGLSHNQKIISEKDKIFLNFAKKNKIDFIGLSFIENQKQIINIKKYLKSEYPKIISKIENKEGLKNLKEILPVSDGILIDRGDLAVETGLENLSINQKKIISISRLFLKPVIVATEIMDNMVENSFLTKAEVSDISNFVLDGSSAAMLSAETAVGSNPIYSVKIMKKIINKVEKNYSDKIETIKFPKKDYIATASAISNICESIKISKIIAVTRSGFAARTLSSMNIKQQIIAVSDNFENAKIFNLYKGVQGYYFKNKFEKTNLHHIPKILKELYEKKIIKNSEQILLTAVAYPNTKNRMNMIETHHVSDLVKTFKWKIGKKF